MAAIKFNKFYLAPIPIVAKPGIIGSLSAIVVERNIGRYPKVEAHKSAVPSRH